MSRASRGVQRIKPMRGPRLGRRRRRAQARPHRRARGIAARMAPARRSRALRAANGGLSLKSRQCNASRRAQNPRGGAPPGRPARPTWLAGRASRAPRAPEGANAVAASRARAVPLQLSHILAAGKQEDDAKRSRGRPGERNAAQSPRERERRPTRARGRAVGRAAGELETRADAASPGAAKASIKRARRSRVCGAQLWAKWNAACPRANVTTALCCRQG